MRRHRLAGEGDWRRECRNAQLCSSEEQDEDDPLLAAARCAAPLLQKSMFLSHFELL
jgi:hypothetical protein